MAEASTSRSTSAPHEGQEVTPDSRPPKVPTRSASSKVSQLPMGSKSASIGRSVSTASSTAAARRTGATAEAASHARSSSAPSSPASGPADRPTGQPVGVVNDGGVGSATESSRSQPSFSSLRWAKTTAPAFESRSPRPWYSEGQQL